MAWSRRNVILFFSLLFILNCLSKYLKVIANYLFLPFMHFIVGAKSLKTIRRKSDSALASLPNEDKSFAKVKELINAVKLQQERIASPEKKVQMVHKMFLHV